MAERTADRDPSISSSATEADHFDDKDKICSSESLLANLNTSADHESGDDMERIGLLPTEDQDDQMKPAHSKQGPAKGSAIIWMVVNTLATIGIVSSSADIFRFAVFTNIVGLIGLHKQNYLFRFILKTCTTFLRDLSFLYNMAHAIHTFSTSIPTRYFLTQKSSSQRNHPFGNYNGVKRHSSKFIPRLFDYYFLPSRAYSTYTNRCTYELRFI